MKDKEFKDFDHIINSEHIITTRGKRLKGGYSPDVSISNKNDNIIYILESERKSDRKAFIGTLIKAVYFCEQNNHTSTLIIIMRETSNQTTVKQISLHLKDYYTWIQNLGASKLKEVLIMSDDAYKASNEAKEEIGSTKFLSRCIALSHL